MTVPPREIAEMCSRQNDDGVVYVPRKDEKTNRVLGYVIYKCPNCTLTDRKLFDLMKSFDQGLVRSRRNLV
jgi:hypothetical protein